MRLGFLVNEIMTSSLR